jgi:hypothetical protein
LTEFVQFTHFAIESGGSLHDSRYQPDPSQKRYALFKDGVRLEEDKLLAELLDPQVLWNRVVCVFMEIGVAHKQTPSPRKYLRDSEKEENDPDASDDVSDDCHLLVLYRKQQAFRNFHFNPAISVGMAIKIITDSFNVPTTTINQDDWSFRLRRSSGSMPKLNINDTEVCEGSGSSGSTPSGSASGTRRTRHHKHAPTPTTPHIIF